MAAAKPKAKSKLASAVKKRKPVSLKLNHPSKDDPTAPYRQPYRPPKPEDRFQFLKTFSTIPALRTKGNQPPQG